MNLFLFPPADFDRIKRKQWVDSDGRSHTEYTDRTGFIEAVRWIGGDGKEHCKYVDHHMVERAIQSKTGVEKR